MLNVKKQIVNAIEMQNITMTFNKGAIVANKNINLIVRKGEIHALVGENGAGKSTLMSILFGIYKPDSGKILVNGKEVHFKSAFDASKEKIGMVHQHFKLVNNYTLWENIILGAEPIKYGFINRAKAKERILEIANNYHLPINLDSLVSDASVGEQQRVEILKLLYRDADILIFDEPTAVLSDQEIHHFLQMLKDFQSKGKTIILITHKLNEVKAIANRTTVIRRGEYIGTYEMNKTPLKKIANAMVGHSLKKIKNTGLNKNFNHLKPILKINNLHCKKIGDKHIDAIKNFNLEIKAGEILGIAGIEGNGQSELALLLGGIIKPTSGTIGFISNKNVEIDIAKTAIRSLYKSGIAHVPEDRHKYGLILDESVAFNVVSPQIDEFPFSRFGFLNKRNIYKYAKYVCVEYDVRGANNGKAISRMLSGGNQQKLVLGREMLRPHKLLIMVQPVRGLDVGAIQQIHTKIMNDANQGAAIILISYELDEILEVANRVIVMDEGEIVYQNLVKNTSRKILGSYISRSAQKATRTDVRGI